MFSIMQRFITILNVKFDLSKRGVCLVHAQQGRGGEGRGGEERGGRWTNLSLIGHHPGFRLSPEGWRLERTHFGQLWGYCDADPQAAAGNGHLELLEGTPC